MGGGTGRRGGRVNCNQAGKTKLFNLIKNTLYFYHENISIYFMQTSEVRNKLLLEETKKCVVEGP